MSEIKKYLEKSEKLYLSVKGIKINFPRKVRKKCSIVKLVRILGDSEEKKSCSPESTFFLISSHYLCENNKLYSYDFQVN